MRPGYAVYIHRVAPFSARTAAAIATEIAHLIAGRTPVFVVAIFFGVVLAAQAQESVQEVALPPWSEPTLPSMEPAPSTQEAPLPSVTEPLPSTLAEPLPSSTEPLPSSEEAFPSSPDPWSSFDELHHSANNCYVGASGRRALRGVLARRMLRSAKRPPRVNRVVSITPCS